MIIKPYAYNPNSGTTYSGTTQYGNIAVATGVVDYTATGLKWWSGPIEDNKYIIARPNLNTLNPRFAGTGNTDAQFLNLTNKVFHTNLPSASSAQTWLTSMGYYTNWFQIIMPLISAGYYYSMAIKNGQVWGWGYSGAGRLGNNDSTTNKCTPVSILGTKKTFCKIKAAQYTTAIDNNGQVWGWGYNGAGQLGNNSTIDKCTPVSIQGTKKTFCKIDNFNQTYGIDKYGQIWSWGYNSQGQLGINSMVCTCTPVSILGAKKTFCEISAGNSIGIGIDKNGQVWSWGENQYGQLGNNSTINKCTPVSIQGTKKTFCIISSGFKHTVGIDKNGQVWGWGYNEQCQLGTNSSVYRCTPVSIHGTKKTFCQIAGGIHQTIGIDKNGQVWGWGYNLYGQLGTNSIVSTCTPVSILGTKKTFCDIYTKGYYSVGVDKNGYVWCWGANFYGELGNNTTTLSQLTPVRVCNF